MNRTLVNWIVWFALFGVLLSAYSLAQKTGFVSGALCNINNTFNCDIVNRGPYSEIYGIPVAVIGVLGYLFLFVAALLKRHDMHDRVLSLFLFAASAGGLVFALYLTSLEAFVLLAWCVVCLASQVLIAIIALLSFIQFQSERHV